MNAPNSTLRTRRARLAAIAGAVALVVSPLVLATTTATAATDPCAVGGNPIICENSKPGANPSEWEINGAGDGTIQGFATDISVNIGSRIDFKIDTNATSYTIDIYRTGWYGGLGARKITSVPVTATLPQRQPECMNDVTTGLYDCGNWAVSASWSVPGTAVSGVYLARLRRADLNATSHITFVVRDDSSRSELLFQTSDTSWQAYNRYGGSNFYGGGANGRAYKVSYNRPFATRAGVTKRDFYFGAEYPMVRFLERNGYDISYTSGVDTDRRGALLLNHKVFLSVGHDEYWSAAQRANVEAARDAGVSLAFFTGNEAYWKTRFEDSVAGAATANRTLVSYKETWSNAKIDPSPEWTGTWRDPRFASQSAGGGRPENGLTGTLYTSNFSDLPVTVSAEEGKLRLWRGTALASLAAGQTAALAPHTVGYESNEDLDNGARPAGLIRLSTTTGAVPELLQDFGNTVLPGTTTHNLTAYRAPSGALVFSAGSIQWSWGLDQTHDGNGAPADSRMQQATVNILADMGAQPATLMTGLVGATKSTDTSAPTVTITAPAAGAAIANGASVTVTGTATDVGGGRVAGVEVSTDGGTRWHPATGSASWTYTYIQAGQGTVPILVRGIDDSANIGGTPATRNVTVACPCSLFGSVVPAIPAAADPGAAELGLRLTPSVDGFISGVRFYKGTGNAGTHTGSLWSATGQRLATVQFANETATGWQSATFAAPVAVAAGQTYSVSYTATQGRYAVATDFFASSGVSAPPLAAAGGFGAPPGGVYGAAGTFPALTYRQSNYYVDALFTTAAETPMTVSGQSPPPGATSVPVGTGVSAVFSKPVQTGSATLTLATSGGAAVTGSTTFDSPTRTVRFVPAAALATGTAYTATVNGNDVNGGGVTGSRTWSFTTAAASQPPGLCPCSLFDDATVPSVLEAADPGPVSVGVRFASTVAGTVTGVRFYKGPNNTGTHTGTLWSATGMQLATATFTGESTMGWQTVTFAQPVQIAANTEYYASYRAPNGKYSATLGAFTGAGLARDPLRIPANGGAYTYGVGAPLSASPTNYLVDVVFNRGAVPPFVVAASPAANEIGANASAPVSATFSEAIQPGAAVQVTTVAGAAVPGVTSLSADSKKLTFTPSTALAESTGYNVAVTGATSLTGVPAGAVNWSFTTAGTDSCPCALFGDQVPAIAASGDLASIELGVAFTPAEDGRITGVRFFKGQGNGGTHTGSLWTAAGQRLATVQFANESVTGWQTALFSQPVQVDPGTTYVVSYLAPQGNYSYTTNFFSAPWLRGPLAAPVAGNGRFRYGGGFPTGTWNATNYFVDVVFQRTPPTPPTVISVSPASGSTGADVAATVTATLSKVPASGTPVLAVSGPSGSIAGASAFDATSKVVTFTPAGALPPATVVSATTSLAGAALAGGAWSFTTASAPSCPCSLWTDTDLPAAANWNDTAAVQVGVRFTTTVAGTVSGVRFYKGPLNTGTHTVNLWSSAGALMATAVPSAESASGWQTVPFAQPVAVAAGQTYTAAYHSTTGRYALTVNGLSAVRTRGPLSTVANGGAYLYGTGFPANAVGHNYWVDVLFTPSS